MDGLRLEDLTPLLDERLDGRDDLPLLLDDRLVGRTLDDLPLDLSALNRA